MRILELPTSNSKKFGSKRAHHGSDKSAQEECQLDLFSAGRILQLHPLSPFEEALKMDEKGDADMAKNLYQKAIEADDMPADAYCNLGILESQSDNPVKAIDYLTLSLKHNPRHLEAHFNLANMYAESGNRELGMLHYKISIEIDPAFCNSYFNLALCLAEVDQYEEAIKVLNKYCGLAPASDRHSALELIRKLQPMLEVTG